MRLIHFIIDLFLDYGNVFFWVWTAIHAAVALFLVLRLKPYETFISMRYIKSRRKQVMISFVTILSVIGVALGVAALIAVLGGMTGFENDLREKILGANSQLSLIKYQDGISDWPELLNKLKKIDGIKAATPYIERQVLIMRENRSYGVMYRGLDPKSAPDVIDIRRAFEEGAGTLDSLLDPTGDLPPIAIGQDLAYKLGAFIGDEISVLNPQGGLGPFGLRPEIGRYRVSGIFRFGLWEIDANVAIVGMVEAQRFLRIGDTITGVELKVSDPMRVRETAVKIRSDFDYPYVIRDWEDINRPLFSALKLERVLSAWVLGIMIIVAGFSIVITLILLVMEKYRDIAVLKTMGASEFGIMSIFMLHGLMVGFIGAALGIIIGGALVLSQQQWHWITLDPSVYYISYLPIEVTLLDIFKIAVFAMSMSFYATLYPSRKAAKMDPAEALRYE